MSKRSQPTARVELVVRTDASSDPDDEASRSERGANDAPKEPPAVEVEREDDPDDENIETAMDAYSMSCDDDGNLTDAARGRMAAKNFAVPDKERLPIHDADHVKAAMKKFPEHPFDDADERHGAFNRIVTRAKEFGVSSTNFQRAHGAKLDRAAGPRSDTSMTADEIKKLQAKSEERKTQRNEARQRADAAEGKVKELEGKVAGLEGQVDVLKGKLETAEKGRLDSAAIDKIVADRAELVATATSIGAQVTAAMQPIEIKRAVIKHLDKKDVPADRHPEYVEALYQGAVERHREDAAATQAGANALGAARGAGGVNAPTVVQPPPATAALPTEAEVAARMRNDSLNGWAKPGNAAALRGNY